METRPNKSLRAPITVAFRQAEHAYLRAAAEASPSLDALLTAHPGFLPAHLLKIAQLVAAKDAAALPALERALVATLPLEPSAGPRERAHIAAARAWLAREPLQAAKIYTLTVSLIEVAFGLQYLFSHLGADGTFPLVHDGAIPWITSYGITYDLAMDGISMPLVMLGILLLPIVSAPFSVARLQAQNAPPDRVIDASTRTAVIDGALAALNESYVYPDVAKQMEHAIRARHASRSAGVMPQASSAVNREGARGRGRTGNGCVGQASSPTTVLRGTARSSTGNRGAPVSRCRRKRWPILVATTTAGRALPSRVTVTSVGWAGTS